MRLRPVLLALLCPLLIAGAAGGATTAPAPVTLKASPAIAPGIDAFPRLGGPAGDRKTERINQALDRRDDKVRAAAKSCRAEGGKGAQWTRRVAATMIGPAYLSLVAKDSWSCGGASPDNSTMALVYDLATGAPVNWAPLLPESLAAKTGTDSVGDGTVIGHLSSPVLQDLYLAGGTREAECTDALRDQSLAFILWPAAAAGGLAIQPAALPRALRACGDPVTIPLPRLRALGVRADLLNAIEEAQRQGWHDRAPR